MGFTTGILFPGTAAALLITGALAWLGRRKGRPAYTVAAAALATMLAGAYLLFMRWIVCM